MRGRAKKLRRILILAGGSPRTGLVPSSRFRVFSYLPQMRADDRLAVTISVSRPSKSFHERPTFKGHPLAAPPLVAIGFVLMLLTRMLDLLRSPFYDAVLLQRPLFPGRPFPFLELAICALNRRVIFDFDDAIFADHHSSGRKALWKRLRLLEDPRNVERIVRRSAHVIAGNEYLADFARRHNANVSVIPTPIDTAHYVPRQPRKETDQRLVVGWIGTSGNLGYVEELAPVFRALQQRYSFELQIVCNPVDRPLQLDGVQYHWTDWSLPRERELLSEFDIGIMPLPDRPWERGKCGFKLLQYMACGIPAVASPVGVNAQIISNGHNGFLAPDPADWERLIATLICDQDLRTRLARNGRTTVERNYALDTVYPKLAHVLHSVAAS